MKSWRTVGRRVLLAHSRFLTVEEHEVLLPNGRIIADWPWVVLPDYINVVAITVDERFLFFEQTKYSIEGTSLAPVGGYLEAGERPLAAAQRELLEETGYEAAKWTSLGSFAVDGNRGAGTAHFFLAEQAQRVADSNADDLEEQKLLHLSRQEVETAVGQGQIKLLPWISIVMLALRTLDK